jgi:multiple sugar transport system ATP-binding protein
MAPKDRDIAMVFQNYALYPHMSVRDNMAFALKMGKVPQEERDKRVAEAAKLLGLEQFLDRKPKALSGGQRQRVAMGRAIVRQPQVFCMDEPLSNLDAKMRVQTRTDIAKLQASLGVTTVYVTHDQVEAMTLADRVVVMNGGIIEQVGPPQELYHRPTTRFVAGFIGSPAMNFVEAEVTDGQLKGPGDWSIPVPPRARNQLSGGQRVIAGFRPEHLEIGPVEGESGSFRARADVVEYLGNEELLHVSAADQDLVAIVDSDHRVRPNDIVDLKMPLEKVHLFDPETGDTIIQQPAEAAA